MKISRDLAIAEPEEEVADLAPLYKAFDSDAEDQNAPEAESQSEENEDEVEEQSDLTRLVMSIYSELNLQTDNDAYFAEPAILTTNSEVHHINEEVTKRLYGAAKEYMSVDTVQEGTDEDGRYETEFLNSLSISGIPPHRLVLKVGYPTMMICNINTECGLCNGTRLRVAEMRDNCIRAAIMTGSCSGQNMSVPRIVFTSNKGDFPFQLRRKQFLVVPAFAMAINKAQGQSLHHMGLYLPGPVFAHGQLYVALSRVTSRTSIKIAVVHPMLKEADRVYTKNAVYHQIFDH